MSIKVVCAGLAGAALVTFVTVYFLTDGYGKVSPAAYRCATALYGACMAEGAIRLNKVEEILRADQGLEETSELLDGKHPLNTFAAREKRWLRAIVKEAREGNWKSAALSARQMMEDQVER